jgi:hypothetical protein
MQNLNESFHAWTYVKWALLCVSVADNQNRVTAFSERLNRRTLKKICPPVYLLRLGHRPLGMTSTLGALFFTL